MPSSSRIAWRVFVVFAVVAASALLGALPVGGQENSGEDEQEAAAPRDEVAAVSGEAFGAEAEIEARLVDTAPLDVSALRAAARTGDTTGARAILEAAVSSVGAANGAPPATFSDELGPEPEVELPAAGGGPISDSEDGLDIVDVDGPLNVADEAEVETQGLLGAQGFAESSVTASGLGNQDFIDEIETECRADLGDLEGSTRIESDSDVFPRHPDENTVLVDDTFEETDPGNPNVVARLHFLQIVNEQDEEDDAITVNGYREVFEFEVFDATQGPDPIEFYRFEATVAHVHCDIAPGPAPLLVEPTFTG